MLDVRLIKLWLSIPSKENYFRGMGRYLHRRAIDGVVPKMVTWKRSKDMGSITRHDFGGEQGIPTDFVTHLHPVLKKLVDIGKLSKLSASSVTAGNPVQDGQSFQHRRSLLALNQVDQWLREISKNDEQMLCK